MESLFMHISVCSYALLLPMHILVSDASILPLYRGTDGRTAAQGASSTRG